MLGELSAAQIERLLHDEVIGRIGCIHDGRPYVVPVTYAYDGEAVFAHSAIGKKIDAMRANPEVCFEVEHVDDMANWQSVVAEGRFEELEGQDAERGMAMLLERFMPLMTSESAQPGHGVSGHRADTSGRVATIFRLVLGTKTGRFEKR